MTDMARSRVKPAIRPTRRAGEGGHLAGTDVEVLEQLSAIRALLEEQKRIGYLHACADILSRIFGVLTELLAVEREAVASIRKEHEQRPDPAGRWQAETLPLVETLRRRLLEDAPPRSEPHITNQVAALCSSIVELRGQADARDGRIEAISTNVADLRTQLQGVRSRLPKLGDPDPLKMHNLLVEARAELGALLTRVGALERKQAEIIEEMETHDDLLEYLNAKAHPAGPPVPYDEAALLSGARSEDTEK